MLLGLTPDCEGSYGVQTANRGDGSATPRQGSS
jgi:hypothetical protein